MRERKWCIGPHGGAHGLSAVAAMLPRHKGGDRVVVSVVAASAVIEANGAQFLRVLLEERDRHFASSSRRLRTSEPASKLRALGGAAGLPAVHSATALSAATA